MPWQVSKTDNLQHGLTFYSNDTPYCFVLELVATASNAQTLTIVTAYICQLALSAMPVARSPLCMLPFLRYAVALHIAQQERVTRTNCNGYCLICCFTLVLPSQFGFHAGSTHFTKPV